jgi:hypothetical protein
MKKIALAVVIAVVAASPALAAKKKAPPAQPDVWQLNDNGRRFLVDSFPIYYPSVVKLAIYPTGAAAPAGKKKR